MLVRLRLLVCAIEKRMIDGEESQEKLGEGVISLSLRFPSIFLLLLHTLLLHIYNTYVRINRYLRAYAPAQSRLTSRSTQRENAILFCVYHLLPYSPGRFGSSILLFSKNNQTELNINFQVFRQHREKENFPFLPLVKTWLLFLEKKTKKNWTGFFLVLEHWRVPKKKWCKSKRKKEEEDSREPQDIHKRFPCSWPWTVSTVVPGTTKYQAVRLVYTMYTITSMWDVCAYRVEGKVDPWEQEKRRKLLKFPLRVVVVWRLDRSISREVEGGWNSKMNGTKKQ